MSNRFLPSEKQLGTFHSTQTLNCAVRSCRLKKAGNRRRHRQRRRRC